MGRKSRPAAQIKVRARLTDLMTTAAWTHLDLPDLTGRSAVVTGANSGIGLVTANHLAARGADVTLAVRDLTKGDEAADLIRDWATADRLPAPTVTVARLDLADLSRVHEFAACWSQSHPEGLDLLVNNAGIMATPRRGTVDGFESQFATNHLGHFALTGLLLPALVARPRSRVVTVSSQAHRMGRMNFDDLMGTRHYNAWRAYAQSKLANLLFTGELQRRLDDNGISTLSMAAHPGYASTNLQSAGPRLRGSGWQERVARLGNRLLGQSAEMGALPTLFAATAAGLPGDSYAGPNGPMEQHGYPRLVDRSKAAKNRTDAAALWDASVRLTGVRYPFDS